MVFCLFFICTTPYVLAVVFFFLITFLNKETASPYIIQVKCMIDMNTRNKHFVETGYAIIIYAQNLDSFSYLVSEVLPICPILMS